MKKTTFLTFIVFLLFSSVNAQVLWNEDFESYTLGNLGTDVTNTTPGQGNWYSGIGYPFNDVVNENFRIENENGRGKYLMIKSTLIDENKGYQKTFRFLHKSIASIWNIKDPTNNIIKFEIDFNYYHFSSFSIFAFGISNDHSSVHSLEVSSDNNGGMTEFYISEENLLPNLITTSKKWYKTILYLDLDNNDSYIEFPSLNYTIKSISKTGSYPLSLSVLNEFWIHFTTDDNYSDSSFLKVDNIKISAVNTLPTLNIVNLDSSKFNLYPNPVTNIVNITNNENMSVKQVEIYDLAGKLINTQHFNNETEIQLNVETLKNGTYLLHLHTNEGVAVKKLIKK